MNDKNTVLEILKNISFWEEALNDISALADDAFLVFEPTFPLNEMNEKFENSWKKLINRRTKSKVPYFSMQAFSEIESAFYKVTHAVINRDEFSEALSESRTTIEKCLANMQKELSSEQKKLDELYDEFAKNANEFKFIFKEEKIKQLIMDKFLKS